MSTPQTAREIILGLPARFRPEKAAGFDMIVHLQAKGSNGGDFTIRVVDSQCHVQEGLEGTATCVVTTTDENYASMESGQLNPTMAVMTGKVKVSNVGQLVKFTALFSRLES